MSIVLGCMDWARQEQPAEALIGEGVSSFGSWEGHYGLSAERGVPEAAGVCVWALESHFLSGNLDPTT